MDIVIDLYKYQWIGYSNVSWSLITPEENLDAITYPCSQINSAKKGVLGD